MSVKTLNLLSALTVQEGAVVSREIMKEVGGTVTLFAFGKGEGLSDHQTPFSVLITILSGEVDCVVNGEAYHLSSHDSLILPPSTPHSLIAQNELKMLLVMIKPAILG